MHRWSLGAERKQTPWPDRLDQWLVEHDSPVGERRPAEYKTRQPATRLEDKKRPGGGKVFCLLDYRGLGKARMLR